MRVKTIEVVRQERKFGVDYKIKITLQTEE